MKYTKNPLDTVKVCHFTLKKKKQKKTFKKLSKCNEY